MDEELWEEGGGIFFRISTIMAGLWKPLFATREESSLIFAGNIYISWLKAIREVLTTEGANRLRKFSAFPRPERMRYPQLSSYYSNPVVIGRRFVNRSPASYYFFFYHRRNRRLFTFFLLAFRPIDSRYLRAIHRQGKKIFRFILSFVSRGNKSAVFEHRFVIRNDLSSSTRRQHGNESLSLSSIRDIEIANSFIQTNRPWWMNEMKTRRIILERTINTIYAID